MNANSQYIAFIQKIAVSYITEAEMLVFDSIKLKRIYFLDHWVFVTQKRCRTIENDLKLCESNRPN